MATIKRFEDIDVWKKADNLSRKIYELTSKTSFMKDYSLKDQLRRASVSVMANISEGFEREGNKELRQFLSMAKGSAGEVRCLLHIAKREQYINGKDYVGLNEEVINISKMLFGFIRYLGGSSVKGNKYRRAKNEI